MAVAPSDISSVLSSIIALGANGGEQIYLPKVHAVLHHMKQHNRMLAGLWFSITGSVFYSRDIENVLRDLSFQGILKIEEGSVAVVKKNTLLRDRMRRLLPVRQYRKLLRVSRNFHARMTQ
ncbi:MAG: hypothetical protein HY896_06050 [Deltaproteobacteria bacterium]|nr:hypothetical protein [Deltaproteobacteria bacterium]